MTPYAYTNTFIEDVKQRSLRGDTTPDCAHLQSRYASVNVFVCGPMRHSSHATEIIKLGAKTLGFGLSLDSGYRILKPELSDEPLVFDGFPKDGENGFRVGGTVYAMPPKALRYLDETFLNTIVTRRVIAPVTFSPSSLKAGEAQMRFTHAFLHLGAEEYFGETMFSPKTEQYLGKNIIANRSGVQYQLYF